jgi:branched-subunit amino acid transport protein
MNNDLFSIDLVPLALLGGLGTYAARVLPMLVPGIDRLPPSVLEYLRLIGPAVLGAIAASSVFVQGGTFTVGAEAVAVFAGAAVGRWRGNLLVGMVVSVLVVSVLRATLGA